MLKLQNKKCKICIKSTAPGLMDLINLLCLSSEDILGNPDI